MNRNDQVGCYLFNALCKHYVVLDGIACCVISHYSINLWGYGIAAYSTKHSCWIVEYVLMSCTILVLYLLCEWETSVVVMSCDSLQHHAAAGNETMPHCYVQQQI